jgi:hypothetical protein
LSLCEIIPVLNSRSQNGEGEPLTAEQGKKVTFYAAPDVKEWLDTLDAGIKSKTINSLLRIGISEKTGVEERLALIEGRLKNWKRRLNSMDLQLPLCAEC